VIDFDTITRRMVVEHASGDSYRTIGRRHGMSHEAARQIVDAVLAPRRLADPLRRPVRHPRASSARCCPSWSAMRSRGCQNLMSEVQQPQEHTPAL